VLTVSEEVNEEQYADALSTFSNASVVLFGVPFDATSSHRHGTVQAPAAIRKESYNYETFLNRYDFNIGTVNIHDLGDSREFVDANDMISHLPGYIKSIVETGKFLITLGGEHSITVPIVDSFHKFFLDKKQDLGIIYLDAHLDFRDSYLDDKFSHACVARRLSEIVGVENIVEVGVRSFCQKEAKDATNMDLKFLTADEVNKQGILNVLKTAKKQLGDKLLYLTLDMDVFDPAYAPGVGNPEYFGLTPWQVRECIEFFGPNLIGADIVEVSPPFDNGNTAALAAQVIQLIISQKYK
jgi:agmatinase